MPLGLALEPRSAWTATSVDQCVLKSHSLLGVTRVDFRGLTKPWLPTLRRTLGVGAGCPSSGVVVLVPSACGLIYGLTWPIRCTPPEWNEGRVSRSLSALLKRVEH